MSPRIEDISSKRLHYLAESHQKIINFERSDNKVASTSKNYGHITSSGIWLPVYMGRFSENTIGTKDE